MAAAPMSHDLAPASAKAHWAALFAGLSGATVAIAAGKLSGTYGGEISVDLTSIKSVSVSQGFFGKLLGFGSVLIATPSGTKSLDFVANPDAFASDLEEAAAAAKKGASATAVGSAASTRRRLRRRSRKSAQLSHDFGEVWCCAAAQAKDSYARGKKSGPRAS